MRGVLIKVRAQGSDASPLTKEKVLNILKDDPYIEVLSER
jgi:hypothetical protein